MQLPSQPRPAANLSISPRAQTKPVQPEIGLPAPTCPRNAALVGNISGKAEGPRYQSLSLGTYQTRAVISTGMCKAGRGVHVGRGGLCGLVEECTLAPSPNDKGWFSAEKPLPSPSPAPARFGQAKCSCENRGQMQILCMNQGKDQWSLGGGVIFRTA